MARDKFYGRAAWLRAREEALRRDHHLCAAHRARGELTPASMVHHITPLAEAPERGLELDNLMALCEGCHNQLHPERARARNEENATIAPAGVTIIKI